ncbi:hypothetical protein COU58_02805 [Candidatus Pacearchaeota archaeon CG10_big_fil_rev_8_21_14_0_10_32_42]|nr:MAG: hypothetical protein COU58_02805 [Candidatus Pacearchaeota archaeon CG10_big_fil_rev_8_21_14_0_10_32_42]
MEEIRNSFKKVKEDFSLMEKEIFYLKKELFETKALLIEVCEALSRLDISFNHLKQIQTQKRFFEGETSNFKTDMASFKARNGVILGISKGNEGVQTDRQTDRQTDNLPEKSAFFKEEELPVKEKQSFEEALVILNSLDNLKKEIRRKFKKLTPQEMLVFSAIYQLEEEKGFSDYKSLSLKLNLTESSIRDYVRRIILKGIPLKKSKENNKEVRLYISENLKKAVSLDTILKLIEI